MDGSGRPLLRIVRPDGNPILALVDTGFNGKLWLTKADAIACGIDFDEIDERTGYLAGMRPTRETYGDLRILWFGDELIVDVVIDLDSDHRTIGAGETVAVIGTALISPATLTVNFERRTVAIRQPR